MTTRPPTRVRVHEERGVFVVVASGDFDADERDLLLSAWDEADERNLPVTVLDLSGVTFGDSSFLDSLLRARRRHLTADRRLVIAGPLHHRVVRLLTVTGTLPHFETAISLTDALRNNTPT
ncbi:STAS domain-containing protein [Streptomyces parvus]|uniref:STAS domain-containing protein n=1 Tax=Streptomyces TaxID=1883 RepID=UPI0037B92228